MAAQQFKDQRIAGVLEDQTLLESDPDLVEFTPKLPKTDAAVQVWFAKTALRIRDRLSDLATFVCRLCADFFDEPNIGSHNDNLTIR